jgi:hypothetical protein
MSACRAYSSGRLGKAFKDNPSFPPILTHFDPLHKQLDFSEEDPFKRLSSAELRDTSSHSHSYSSTTTLSHSSPSVAITPKSQRSTSTTTLSISPHKVRQINDPIMPMLNILHKIIYITQLPPTLTINSHRHIVDRFKRELFSPQVAAMIRHTLNG